MRVLVVANMYPTPAGPADGIFIARQVDAIRRNAPKGLELEVLHVDTVHGRHRYVTGASDVLSAVRRFVPDVLHVHFGLVLPMASVWRGPTVATFHGSDLTLPWMAAVSRLFTNADRVTPVVVSPHLVEALPDGARARARVIGCGVDTSRFRPRDRQEARRAQGHADEAILVGFPSSPARPGKDFGLFRETLDALQQRGVPAQEVVLHGVSPDDMADALAALDVVLLTSRHEGSPVITREALCCGTRVVSVDVGDVGSQLEGFGGCEVVAERSGAALADAIECVLAGATGPDTALAAERFSDRREAELVIDAYRAAIGASMS